jgi:hypothetical protein
MSPPLSKICLLSSPLSSVVGQAEGRWKNLLSFALGLEIILRQYSSTMYPQRHDTSKDDDRDPIFIVVVDWLACR